MNGNGEVILDADIASAMSELSGQMLSPGTDIAEFNACALELARLVRDHT